MTNRTPGEAEAEFIKLIEDTRKRAVFPPGDPNGSIPPGIKVQDDCTGKILFELHKDDWLDKWGCIVGGTYHTMFGLPRSLKELWSPSTPPRMAAVSAGSASYSR
jgi:hypothetical protein